MLPNHAPLVIAEQFGTLESLFPGRIDLGLGRAPGSDMATARALRRDPLAGELFPQDVAELLEYFQPAAPGQSVRAVPGAGLSVPVWILGSSLFGAQLAANLGLPFSFASHFAPAMLDQAAELYRRDFQPSAHCDRPWFMPAVNVVAAETEAQARRLFSSVQQVFAALRRGRPTRLPPPVDDIGALLEPAELAGLQQVLAVSVVGTTEQVRAGLDRLAARTQADELMAVSQIYDHADRVRSLELVAAAGGMSGPASP